MRSSLLDTLEGSIGFTGPGYEAPRARYNVDESPGPVALLPGARLAAPPVPKYKTASERRRLARKSAERTADHRSKMFARLLEIVSAAGPCDFAEICMRYGRGGQRVVRARVQRQLDEMVEQGLIRFQHLCGRFGEGRRRVYEAVAHD